MLTKTRALSVMSRTRLSPILALGMLVACARAERDAAEDSSARGGAASSSNEWLAYQVELASGDQTELRVLDVTATSPPRVVSSTLSYSVGGSQRFAWSLDGSALSYLATPLELLGGPTELLIASFEDAQQTPRRVSLPLGTGEEINYPTWSADGSTLHWLTFPRTYWLDLTNPLAEPRLVIDRDVSGDRDTLSPSRQHASNWFGLGPMTGNSTSFRSPLKSPAALPGDHAEPMRAWLFAAFAES